MNIRIMCATDQAKKLKDIFDKINIDAKIYANRNTTKTKRVYINIDDREADTIIDKLEAIIFQIKAIK